MIERTCVKYTKDTAGEIDPASVDTSYLEFTVNNHGGIVVSTPQQRQYGMVRFRPNLLGGTDMNLSSINCEAIDKAIITAAMKTAGMDCEVKFVDGIWYHTDMEIPKELYILRQYNENDFRVYVGGDSVHYHSIKTTIARNPYADDDRLGEGPILEHIRDQLVSIDDYEPKYRKKFKSLFALIGDFLENKYADINKATCLDYRFYTDIESNILPPNAYLIKYDESLDDGNYIILDSFNDAPILVRVRDGWIVTREDSVLHRPEGIKHYADNLDDLKRKIDFYEKEAKYHG